MPGVSGYAVSSVDGSLIHYRVVDAAPELMQGHGESVSARHDLTVVLCDGVGCEGYVWKYLEPVLARCYRVVHWHYRGHGATPRPRDASRLGIADHADDLACVLGDIGIERAALVGHSMGVQVALETWRRHRSKVAGLVLICGAPGRPLSTIAGAAGDLALSLTRQVTSRVPWLVNGFMRAIMPTDLAYRIATRLEIDGSLLHQEDFMPYLRGMAAMDVNVFLDCLYAANQHTAVDILGDIDVPALVIGGSDDGMTSPVESERMFHAIPRAELCIVDGGTHTAPIEYPELVCQTVLDFLRRRLL